MSSLLFLISVSLGLRPRCCCCGSSSVRLLRPGFVLVLVLVHPAPGSSPEDVRASGDRAGSRSDCENLSGSDRARVPTQSVSSVGVQSAVAVRSPLLITSSNNRLRPPSDYTWDCRRFFWILAIEKQIQFSCSRYYVSFMVRSFFKSK